MIASWLLDLTAAALLEDPELSKFAGRVSDSGEGRWTIKAAIDEAVPVPVLASALSSDSLPAATPIMPTSCFRRCDINLADIWRSRRITTNPLPLNCGVGFAFAPASGSLSDLPVRFRRSGPVA